MMTELQKVPRIFKENDPPCWNCVTNGSICLAQVTPSSLDVCLECCNKGLEPCNSMPSYQTTSASIDLTYSQSMSASALVPNEYIDVGGNIEQTSIFESGTVVACHRCQTHSVMIRDFGNFKLCTGCIANNSRPSSPPLTDAHHDVVTAFVYMTQPHSQAVYTYEDSGGMQSTSPDPSSSPSSLFLTHRSVLQSTEAASNSTAVTTFSQFESGSTQSLKLRPKLKCDRCSAKKIVCTYTSTDTLPCNRCIAEHVHCTVSASRRLHPGTCGECARRKIRCVGVGEVCYACVLYNTADRCQPSIRGSTINGTPKDHDYSPGPSKKRERKGGSDDDNNNYRKRTTTSKGYDGGQNESNSPANSSQWNIYSRSQTTVSLYSMKGRAIQIRHELAITRVRDELILIGCLKQNLNIVNFYGLILDRLTLTLIVELARSSLDRYLTSICQKDWPISLTIKLRLRRNVFEGLLALINAEVIDIKKSNVLVFIDKKDDSLTAKVSDFGLLSSSNVCKIPTFAKSEFTRALAIHPKLSEWNRDDLQDLYIYGLFLWQIAMDGRGQYEISTGVVQDRFYLDENSANDGANEVNNSFNTGENSVDEINDSIRPDPNLDDEVLGETWKGFSALASKHKNRPVGTRSEVLSSTSVTGSIHQNGTTSGTTTAVGKPSHTINVELTGTDTNSDSIYPKYHDGVVVAASSSTNSSGTITAVGKPSHALNAELTESDTNREFKHPKYRDDLNGSLIELVHTLDPKRANTFTSLCIYSQDKTLTKKRTVNRAIDLIKNLIKQVQAKDHKIAADREEIEQMGQPFLSGSSAMPPKPFKQRQPHAVPQVICPLRSERSIQPPAKTKIKEKVKRQWLIHRINVSIVFYLKAR